MSGNRTIERLVKICGMLGSAHEGERASAALLSSQIINDLDLTWSDVIIAAFSQRSGPVDVSYDDRPIGWHVGYCVWLIHNRGNKLTPWEMKFLTSLAGKYSDVRLTSKQAEFFVKTAQKFDLEV